MDLIAEYTSAGALAHRFVHGPGTDEPLVQYDTATGARLWFHADERGSVVATTNDSGSATAIPKYDEYGVPGGPVRRFMYTGQMWVLGLGMYNYKARMYSPTLGRFMQADPIGYGDGMNMYTYVRNDPANFRDPTGTEGEDERPIIVNGWGLEPMRPGGAGSPFGNGVGWNTNHPDYQLGRDPETEEDNPLIIVTAPKTNRAARPKWIGQQSYPPANDNNPACKAAQLNCHNWAIRNSKDPEDYVENGKHCQIAALACYAAEEQGRQSYHAFPDQGRVIVNRKGQAIYLPPGYRGGY